MTNIGTLFYILWFLGTSLFSFASNNDDPIKGLNVGFSHSDTSGYIEFLPENVKKSPNRIQKIVIDAGHGGHDHGCSGSLSNEKNLTLSIALKLGTLLRETYPDLKVIYTRTSDVFVPLHKRIDLANKEDADIFLSIHANAFHDPVVSGTEVFVMGLHTAEENLRVARRENASVLLESDFQENYDGFDPNSPEAQIILSMYQNAYLDKSISLAKKISDAIAGDTGFINRGVKQAGFVILRKAAMPSVLIETGFLSNEEDELLLHSEEGKNTVAEAIASAIAKYKNEVENERRHLQDIQERTELVVRDQKQSFPADVVVYRLQLGAFRTDASLELPEFIAGQSIDVRKEGGLQKITSGKFETYEEARDFQENVRKNSAFKQAFVVAYRADQRISIDEAKSGVEGGE
jgi:N-acetylmuramoyl-L-alanine amidase